MQNEGPHQKKYVLCFIFLEADIYLQGYIIMAATACLAFNTFDNDVDVF